MLRQFMDSALKSLTGTVDKLTKTKFKYASSFRLARLCSATENSYAGKNANFILGAAMSGDAGFGCGDGGGRGF